MAKHVEKCPFSPGQMEALSAICDTLLPSIDLSDRHHHQLDDSVIQFFQASASMAGTPQRVRFDTYTHMLYVAVWRKRSLSSFKNLKPLIFLHVSKSM